VKQGIEYSVGPRTVKTSPFNFFSGVAVSPFKVREPDQMMQLYKLELKIAAGARYVITQLGYDLRKLYELKQYMAREGMGHIPILANVYVPTATVAKMMKEGEVAGCVIPDSFIKKLEGEKKPQRLERAALMVAAVRELGFAGAHIGGFGLTHKDFMTIMQRSNELGGEWRKHMDDLVFAYPDTFYLLPEGSDGLSKGDAPYNAPKLKAKAPVRLRMSEMVSGLLIEEDSIGGRFLAARVKVKNGAKEGEPVKHHGFWYTMVGFPSSMYRRRMLGCLECGDCIQDHLNYSGCSMRYCYKETRNGPCGGSRPDGACEVNPEQQCIWNTVYANTLAAKKDPRQEFARTLLPPRNWDLNRTSALANKLAGLDNTHHRQKVQVVQPSKEKQG